MRNASATQLSEAWSSLLMLVREGCSLSAPSQFLLAALLHELMIKCCPLEEKKDQRDLQDVTAKVFHLKLIVIFIENVNLENVLRCSSSNAYLRFVVRV